MEKKEMLRNLPKMDSLLRRRDVLALIQAHGKARVLDALRQELDAARKNIMESGPFDADIISLAQKRLHQKNAVQRVVNATGILLHTNLGRAPMAKAAAAAAYEAALGYCDLEFDLASGKRGARLDKINALLSHLFSAESALVVNNNAAAVLLMLSALACGRDVITSRGELVEIGGSFRIPEVMEQSGARLKEVGATNKTHLSDYARAVDENTAALLKVHTSNYSIQGFTQSVSLEELKGLSEETGVPLLYDIGSGALLRLSKYGLSDEPLIQKSLAAGCDVVSFSGDKLLGGPQAGILVGKKEYIDKMKSHPLYRALRVDKMCLAALHQTLELYLDEERARTYIPFYRMLEETPERLKKRAQILLRQLSGTIKGAKLCPLSSLCGGGSCPTETLPSFGISIETEDAEAYLAALRRQETPIVARISEGRVLFDMRTVHEEEMPALQKGILCAWEEMQ